MRRDLDRGDGEADGVERDLGGSGSTRVMSSAAVPLDALLVDVEREVERDVLDGEGAGRS